MTTQCGEGRVRFGFFRPEARQVSVAGDFNGWDAQASPMRREPGGEWVCELELAPGSYQFRYLVDGVWVTDCAAFGLQPGPFGWNSVVYVTPSSAGRRRHESTGHRRLTGEYGYDTSKLSR